MTTKQGSVNNNECVFCKIVSGVIPATKIYEDKDVIAILSVGPANHGHTLVLPKAHIENIYDMPDSILSPMILAVKKLARAVKRGMNAEGVNIIMNNERVAGQVIFHAHIHVIPRFTGDGLTQWREGEKYKDGEASEVARKIAESISKD